MPIFADRTTRRAIEEYFVNLSSGDDETAADTANRLLGHPLALWRAENQIARKMKEDTALQTKLGAHPAEGDESGTVQDLLQWLLDNAPAILALVAQILKMFGL